MKALTAILLSFTISADIYLAIWFREPYGFIVLPVLLAALVYFIMKPKKNKTKKQEMKSRKEVTSK